MKYKRLYIATIIFFLLVNTRYYWEETIGMFALMIYLLLILYFIVLTVVFFVQIFFAAREKLIDRKRLLLLVTITFTLGLTFFYPSGIVNFDKFERESLLIAQREGAANCTTTLKLKEDRTFLEKNICFGVTEVTGIYKIKDDTIFFETIYSGRYKTDTYKFAVMKDRDNESDRYLGYLVRYKDYSDTTGTALWIIKNNLKKQQKKSA